MVRGHCKLWRPPTGSVATFGKLQPGTRRWSEREVAKWFSAGAKAPAATSCPVLPFFLKSPDVNQPKRMPFVSHGLWAFEVLGSLLGASVCFEGTIFVCCCLRETKRGTTIFGATPKRPTSQPTSQLVPRKGYSEVWPRCEIGVQACFCQVYNSEARREGPLLLASQLQTVSCNAAGKLCHVHAQPRQTFLARDSSTGHPIAYGARASLPPATFDQPQKRPT